MARIKKKKKTEHTKIIGNAKICTGLNKLCDGIPSCFKEYVNYCRKLEFDETPDYEYLISLLIKCGEENDLEIKYSWNK